MGDNFEGLRRFAGTMPSTRPSMSLPASRTPDAIDCASPAGSQAPWTNEPAPPRPADAPGTGLGVHEQMALFLPDDLEPAPLPPGRKRLPGRIKSLLTTFDPQRKGSGKKAATTQAADGAAASLWPDSFFE